MNRLAISLAVCLAVGAIVSVGVAWIASLRMDRWRWTSTVAAVQLEKPYGAFFEFHRYRGADLAIVKLPRREGVDLRSHNIADVRRGLDRARASSTPGLGYVVPEVPSWLGWPRRSDEPITEWATAALGWPARCMVSHRLGPDWLRPKYRGVFGTTKLAQWPVANLPLLPYWPGLLLNAAVFGAPLWIGCALRRAIRRRRRILRGECSECGYDLQGVRGGCPECGSGCEPAVA